VAATQRRLGDLSTILGKLKAAAAADGSLQWRALLPTLTPGERGRLLEPLAAYAGPATAQAIVVVAGHECAGSIRSGRNRSTRRLTLRTSWAGAFGAVCGATSRGLQSARSERAADFSPRGA